MYHYLVRQKVHASFQQLNKGSYEQVLRQFAPDVTFTFAGDHALRAQLRDKKAVKLWFQELFGIFPGIFFTVHTVVVSGWPWDTKVATHFGVRVKTSNTRIYTNEGVQLLRICWGQIVEDRIYEDTQKLAAELSYLADHGSKATKKILSPNK